MWVVADIFDREATQVLARQTLDGVEMIDGKQMIRIRANYSLEDPITLSTTPTLTAPGVRGDRAAFMLKIRQPYAPVTAEQASGLRFAWFDIDNAHLTRVVDLLLYKLPGHGLVGPAYYLVKYEYTLQLAKT